MNTSRSRRRIAAITGGATLAAMVAVLPAAQAQGDGTVKGTITADDGRRVAGAEAVLCAVEDGTPRDGVAVGTTGPKGNFAIRNVPNGEYTLLYRDPKSIRPPFSYSTRYLLPIWSGDRQAKGSNCLEAPPDQVDSFTVADGQVVADRDGKLPEGGRLMGRTLDTKGNPVRDVQVGYPSATVGTDSVLSGDDGKARYSTAVMEPGKRKVSYFDQNDDKKTVTVTIRKGETTVRDVRFAQPANSAVDQPSLDHDGTNLGEGSLLKITADWYQVRNEPQYRWFRDGKPIAGATGPAYSVTAADKGHRVSATVSSHLKGYPTRSYRLEGYEVPKEDVSIRTELFGRGSVDNPRQLQMHVNVSRESDEPLAGKATVLADRNGAEIEISSARVNEFGDAVIGFPLDLSWNSGDAFVEFVPDDDSLPTVRSDEHHYQLER